MARFFGDIAFLLEMMLAAGGLVLLYHSRKETGGLLRAAARVPEGIHEAGAGHVMQHPSVSPASADR